MTQETKGRGNVLAIVIMFALFFMIAFVTGYQNPLGSVISKLWNGNLAPGEPGYTDMSQVGTLFNFLAYLVMGYPAGLLLHKRGYRFTSLSAVTTGFVGVAITFISGKMQDAAMSNALVVVVYMVGAFIAGLSMCMLNTVVNPMLNSLGGDDKHGNQLVLFGGTFNSLGATLAPMVVAFLMDGAGEAAQHRIDAADNVFYLAMGIFLLAFIVLFCSKLPESETLGQEREKINPLGALKYRHFALGVVAILVYMGIEVGIANISYQYMEKQAGLDQSMVGAICGIYWLLMLVGRFIGGAIGAKVSSRAMLTVASTLGLVLVIAAIFWPASSLTTMVGFDNADGFKFVVDHGVPVSAVLLTLCGLCTSIMWGAIFNLSVSGLGKYTQVASGIFMTMVVGGGIWPLLQSKLAASIGDYLPSFWLVVAFLAYMLFYALIGSRPKAAQVAE